MTSPHSYLSRFLYIIFTFHPDSLVGWGNEKRVEKALEVRDPILGVINPWAPNVTFRAAKRAGKRRDEHVEIQGIYVLRYTGNIAGSNNGRFFFESCECRERNDVDFVAFAILSPLHWRPPTKINGRCFGPTRFRTYYGFFSTDRLVVVSRTFEDKNVRINYEVIPDDLDEDSILSMFELCLSFASLFIPSICRRRST